MNIYEKYPELAASLDRLSRTRYLDLLQAMTESDAEYGRLCRERADTSAALKSAVTSAGALEAYADAVFKQECYELEAVYRCGFCDALELMDNSGKFQEN